MGIYKVVIIDQEYGDSLYEEMILEEIDADVFVYPHLNEEDIIKVAKDCDALLFQYAKITRKIIDQLDNCKIIAKYAPGIDGVDVEFATHRSICVTNVNDSFDDKDSIYALRASDAYREKLKSTAAYDVKKVLMNLCPDNLINQELNILFKE